MAFRNDLEVHSIRTMRIELAGQTGHWINMAFPSHGGSDRIDLRLWPAGGEDIQGIFNAACVEFLEAHGYTVTKEHEEASHE